MNCDWKARSHDETEAGDQGPGMALEVSERKGYSPWFLSLVLTGAQ